MLQRRPKNSPGNLSALLISARARHASSKRAKQLLACLVLASAAVSLSHWHLTCLEGYMNEPPSFTAALNLIDTGVVGRFISIPLCALQVRAGGFEAC